VATSVHPVGAKESRALRRLQRKAKVSSPYVFVSERGAPLSVAGYQRMAARAGGQIGILIRWRALVSRFATKFFSFGQSEE
jgi:type 1 fimbriae regulatory protein FimB/type 1 fimbriae regulatory protein FimE